MAQACAEDVDDEQRAQQLTTLATCLERVPEPGRRLLDRCYRDGWSLERIAQAVGSSYAAVSQALFRLRQRLRTCVERQEAQS